MVQFSTIAVLVAMPITRWEFRIVPWLAEGNISATCLKMLVMRFADMHCAMTCAFELHSMFKAHYKCQGIITNIRRQI